jgi:hypothetical protein
MEINTLQLHQVPGLGIIRASCHPQQGCEERFVEMAKHGDDQLLDEAPPAQ